MAAAASKILRGRTMVVYLITNLVNGKHYVGKTVQPLKERWARHLSKANRGPQYHLHGALRKYGPEAFSIVPLVSILTTDPQLKEYERFWIRLFNANDPRYGYNMTAGGDGSLGWNPSTETRRKIGAAFKGKSLPVTHRRKISEAQKGKRHSAESRLKMSDAKKGNKHCEGRIISVETRAKMSAAGKGRTQSNATRRRIGDANKGKSRSVETRRKMSDAKKGHNVSAETRRKMSLAMFLNTVAWG